VGVTFTKNEMIVLRMCVIKIIEDRIIDAMKLKQFLN